jgi:hydroxyacylglutathione hydrolase
VIFEQIYLDCLSQAAYLIGSEGEAVLVDPRRDVDDYLAAADRHGLTIRHVVATHVHADFVAGLTEIADRTGATVWMGGRFDGDLPCRRMPHGHELRVGAVVLETLETPGHTPESICLLVRGPEGTPTRLLSGDTVFLGDVGRPDLVGARGLSAEDMAGMMFDSLSDHVLPLDDAVEVWPGHGAGSACGKNISAETRSTIGAQRLQNWAFTCDDRDRFVAELCAELPAPPRYFAHAAAMNRTGPTLTRQRSAPRRLGPDECSVVEENGAILLDVRTVDAFGQGHVAGSLHVSLGGRFAEWAGRLIAPGRRIVLVAASEEQALEAFERLARVGHDTVLGWCCPDAAHTTASLPQWTPDELRAALDADPALQVADVRQPGEFRGGRVPGAVSVPLTEFADAAFAPQGLDRTRPVAVICAGGGRSSTASHFLRNLGFADLRNVAGGTGAWRAAGHAVES